MYIYIVYIQFLLKFLNLHMSILFCTFALGFDNLLNAANPKT